MKRDIFLKRMARHGRHPIDFPSDELIQGKYGPNKDEWSVQNPNPRSDEIKSLYDNMYERKHLLRKLHKLKYLTKYIDFKCDFDATGKCSRIRKDAPKSFWSAPKCCCGECASHMGYHEFIPKDRVQYYADLFDARDGYWEKGKGCKIENHADRSQTCVHYSCHPDRKFRRSMDELGHQIRAVERDIMNLHAKEQNIKRRIKYKKT